MIALVMLLLLQGGRQRPAAAPPEIVVQLGTSVTPDTVTVGDPFVVSVRVRAPLGATVEFPNAPDSGAVAPLDPRQVHTNPDSLATDIVAVYRLAAWDVERQPLKLGDIVVHAGGRERRVSLGGLRVFVKSVLPADSALRVPKPQRPIFEFGRPWWIWALLALAAIGIIGLLFWWWWRRRRRGVVPLDPFAEAEAAFTRIDGLELVAAGERGRHVALMVEVLRLFLARRFGDAPASLTTSELLAATRGTLQIPAGRLAGLLAEADLIKFARRPVAADRARELGTEARAIVHAIHDADLAAAEAEPPQKKAA